MKKIAIIIAGFVIVVGCSMIFSRYKSVVEDMAAYENPALSRILQERHQDAFDEDEELLYRLWVPHARNMLPIVLILHGAGGSGTDNLSQLDSVVQKLVSEPIQNRFPSIVAVPQCPPNKQWTDRPFASPPFRNYKIEDTPESSRLRAIIRLIKNLAEEFHADLNRIYVIGFSMGSSGTWDLLARHGDMFAGAITMSGISPPASAAQIAKVPVWAFHGVFDRVSPVHNTSEMVNSLQKHQSDVKFTRLLWGHGIPNIVLNDDRVFEWLFSRRRSPKED